MKRFVKILILTISSLFLSCHSDSESDDGPHIEYDASIFSDEKLSYPDEMIIPDKYNTGIDTSISLSKLTESKDVNGLFITVDVRPDKNVNQYLISTHNQNHVENRDGTLKSEMKDEIIIENYDFSDRPFVCNGGERFSKKKKIIFKNCKFKSFRNPPNETNKIWLEFNHCTFCGGVNEAQISLNYCYIGGFTADAINPTRYFRCTNTYIADLVTNVTDKEVHIDGFQTYGRKDIAGGNIYFNNVRFEIPSIYVEGQHSGTGVNACVMFQLEFGNVDYCVFQNLFINGGGKWFPIYLTNGKKGKDTFSQRNLTLKNAFVSNNFGTIFYSGSFDSTAKIENVAHHDDLYVSSVWKDSAGKTHIICTNDTMYKSTLLVKTDNGNFEFEIPRCPSNWNLEGKVCTSKTKEQKENGFVEDESFLKDEHGKSYKEYKFKDMPFDIDCVINANISELTCFDKENNKQIRKVKF